MPKAKGERTFMVVRIAIPNIRYRKKIVEILYYNKDGCEVLDFCKDCGMPFVRWGWTNKQRCPKCISTNRKGYLKYCNSCDEIFKPKTRLTLLCEKCMPIKNKKNSVIRCVECGYMMITREGSKLDRCSNCYSKNILVVNKEHLRSGIIKDFRHKKANEKEDNLRLYELFKREKQEQEVQDYLKWKKYTNKEDLEDFVLYKRMIKEKEFKKRNNSC